MTSKVQASIALIKRIAAEDGRLIVMFSGGKDSLSAALLCVEAGVKPEAIYMETGLDLPGSVEKAEYYAKLLGIVLHRTNPDRDYQGNFAFQVHKFGYWPTIQHNWCMSRLKVRPCRAYCRKLWGMQHIYKLTGVRRQESGRRRRIYSARQQVLADPEQLHSSIVHPILEWTDTDVKAFLQSYNLEADNRLYAQVGVSGCYWCPFYQDSILVRIERQWPGIYQQLIDLERELGKPALSNHRWLRNVIEDVHSQFPMELGA